MKKFLILLLLTGCAGNRLAARTPEPLPTADTERPAEAAPAKVRATLPEKPTVAEPEFFGQTCLVLDNDTSVELDREVIRMNTRETTTSILFGIGKKKTELSLDGDQAVVRLKPTDEIRFVIRVPDNNFDPIGIINIFRFKQTKNSRTAEIASVSTFGSAKTNNFERLRFTATKYGASSYLITLREKPEGEFGILLNNPYCILDNSMIVSTFAIGE